ncbi:protein Oca4p [Monosporozyma unispora]|nr:hypothetical protein C6P44_003985 [Kazachstania unispora]
MLVPPAGFGIAEEGIYRCSKVETLNLSFLETLNLKTVLFIGGQEPSKFFKEFFNRSSIEWSLLRIADLSSASTVTTIENHRRITAHTIRSTNSNSGSPNNSANKGILKSNSSDSNPPENSTGNDLIPTDNLNASHQLDPLDENDEEQENMESDYTTISSTSQPSFVLNDSADLMLIKSICLRKAFKKLLNVKNYNILLVDKTSLIVGILRKIQKWNISSILNEYRLYSGKHSSYFAETFLELVDIRIEQDNETFENEEAMNNSQLVNLNTNVRPLPRKLSSCVIVTEEDLCKPPEVPKRLINMIQEAERNEHFQLLRKSNDLLIRKLDRKESDLGIFGHRYRLAFNKRENGRYDYYKSYKVRHQQLLRREKAKLNEDIDQGINDKTEDKALNDDNNEDDEEDDVVTINIPKESLLPTWFIYQRDLWEKDNVPDVHHFYKEHIFV